MVALSALARVRTRTLLLVAALLGAGGFAWWRARQGTPATTVVASQAEIVQTLVTIGRVEPPAEIVFVAREATRINRVEAREGDHVAAGTLLVQMDAAEAAAIVEQAQASLQQAQANTRAVATVSAPTAAASLREAQANLEEAKRELDRNESLFARGIVDAAEVDLARTTLLVARNRARTAELQQAAVSHKGAQWQAALAAEMFAEAGLAIAQARLDRLRIVAPSAGTVVSRSAEVGAVVQPGTELMRMTLDGPTRLLIEPDEKNLRVLQVGQRALASAEAFPDLRFDATLEAIAPAVDAMRGTIEVRLAVPQPPSQLRTDMTVSVEIEVARAAAAIALPAAAVRELATAQPWVLVPERGIATRRDVVVGLRGDRWVEITDGLAAGEAVLDDPKLAVGDRVR